MSKKKEKSRYFSSSVIRRCKKKRKKKSSSKVDCRFFFFYFFFFVVLGVFLYICRPKRHWINSSRVRFFKLLGSEFGNCYIINNVSEQ